MKALTSKSLRLKRVPEPELTTGGWTDPLVSVHIALELDELLLDELLLDELLLDELELDELRKSQS